MGSSQTRSFTEYFFRFFPQDLLNEILLAVFTFVNAVVVVVANVLPCLLWRLWLCSHMPIAGKHVN